MLMDTVETAEEYKKSEVPYTLDERLGEGAFGEVFKAIEDGGEGRTFAIKYIKCTENFDENNDVNVGIENALNEISLLVPLKHMNIVRIIDFGARQIWQMEVEFSLVLEYCSNGQLSDYLGKSISKSRKLGWIRSITSAVVYLHDKKITHQDLKPDNVLLAEGDVIKLADFGLARRFGRPVKGQSLRDYYLSQGVGAFCYAAPEMLKERHTNKVDVFSMGILFHAILEGQFEDFDDGRCYGVFVEIAGQRNEPIGIHMHENRRQFRVPFQGRRRRLIERMLKYDPKQRPTAQDVEDVLRSKWRRWFQLTF